MMDGGITVRTFDNIPPLLQFSEGRQEWEAKRNEIIDTVSKTEYGVRPDMDYSVTWQVTSREAALFGKAERIITDITVTTSLGSHTFPLYTFLPTGIKNPPTTLLICSQSRVLAPQKLPDGFRLEDLPQLLEKMNIVMDGPMDLGGSSRALDMASDMDNGHWPVPMMIQRGHAVSGFYATDAHPDNGDFTEGLAKIFGTTKDREETEWGVLAVWAFAASCTLDYLTTLPELDPEKIGITGHSRCGKAALWAGVTDERFAWVMPNNSGCCGAALSRGKHGENISSINTMMPYWFAPAFGSYTGKEFTLPFDQHTVLALVAPRLLHVASGSTDFWADPIGEHRSTVLANEIYRLYGNPEIEDVFPDVNSPVNAGAIGYHLRKGPHLLTEYDWSCLADHIDHFLKHRDSL
jgi:hypothetical protein